MASPAVTSPSSKVPLKVDPYTKARFTLQLGEGITNPSGSNTNYNSVKVNHKPSQEPTASRTSIVAETSEDNYTLTVTDQETTKSSTYAYNGGKTDLKKTYVLVFDPEKQTATLEPLSSAYAFNLTSTPWEQSSSKLCKTYPQLQPHKETEERIHDGDTQDTAMDEDSSGEPDENNPYDYRHFLTKSTRSPSVEPTPLSGLNTPRPDAGRLTPLPTPSGRKAGQTSLKPAPRTQKATVAPRKRKTETLITAKSSNTRAAVPKATKVPSVRLDRRASTRPGLSDPPPAKAAVKGKPKPAVKSQEYVHSSTEESEADANMDAEEGTDADADGEDDGDGLTIDFGDSGPGKHRGRAGLATLPLPDTPADGPISLRSAANSASPGSTMHTPAHYGAAKHNEEVIDFGDMEEDGPGNDEEDVYADQDEALDDDVDGFDLGPPAHAQEKNIGLGVEGVATEPMYEDDEDADFEAELMQGLVDQDDDEMDFEHGMAEESEESEEE
ncbi:hypothetical protein M501DRAFT_968225 [Patellaria atrata CBS 101060]|uniref:Transcription elongation factor Eaf N-terminal domain-containing protein n=1 Tax=Patellaria atrata CBS 101060 TaxID=1346257 RepID=A0A9P4VUJ5_9PEZI|nr:hypothetical protein M501DRAFT_968225 [Patellaria atrata CBS 101060]